MESDYDCTDEYYKEIELTSISSERVEMSNRSFIEYDSDVNMLIYDPDEYDLSVRSCTPIPFSYSNSNYYANNMNICSRANKYSPELGPVASAPPVESIDLLSDTLIHRKSRRGSYDFDADPSQLSETESVYEEKDVCVDTLYIKTPITTDKIFKRPPKSSTSARTVWKQSGLGSQASLYDIERHLMDWAKKYALIAFDTEKECISKVEWNCMKAKATYIAKWETFVRWVLCASVQVPP